MLVFYMLVYIHIIACIWYSVTTIEEAWVPNMDFILFGFAEEYNYYYEYDNYMTLYISWYIGFYLFGIGEVCPRTENEIFLAIPILIVSCIMNGLIIGNMSLYLQELNKKDDEFQQKLDSVNTAMNSLNLDKNLKREISEFFITTNNTSVLQQELDEFMTDRISQTYRILCQKEIFRKTIKENYLTRKIMRKNVPINEYYNSEVINNVVKRMDTMLKNPEDEICQQDEELTEANDNIYFIAKGRCSVLIKDKFANERYETAEVNIL